MKEPEHIRIGREKSKKLKPIDVYNMVKKCYESCIKRGDEMDWVLKGGGGGTFGAFEGFYGLGGYVKGEKIKRDVVAVELKDGRVFKFKLKDIFDDVLKVNKQKTLL